MKNINDNIKSEYGYEIITRENATDAVPKDGEWEELTDGQKPGWKDTWRPFRNMSSRTFRQFFAGYPFLIALRRPIPLGNVAQSPSPPPAPDLLEPMPCLCGSNDIIVYRYNEKKRQAVCDSCNRKGPPAESAILAWNEMRKMGVGNFVSGMEAECFHDPHPSPSPVPETQCCQEWVENIDKINDPIILQSLRNPGYVYNGKPFVYCPWCGKARPAAKKEAGHA